MWNDAADYGNEVANKEFSRFALTVLTAGAVGFLFGSFVTYILFF